MSNQELLQISRDREFQEVRAQLGRFPDLRLSYWTFNNYRTCPQKFALLYIRKPGPRIRDNFYAINGSVVHNLWENFTTRIRTGKLEWSDTDFLTDNTESYYDHFISKEHVEWDHHGVDPAEHKLAAVPRARNSVTFLHQQLMQEGLIPCDPSKVHTELTFRTPFEQGGTGLVLTGRTDLVFEHPTNLTIVDLKDVKDRSKVDWRQLLWYTFGLEPVFAKPVSRAGFLLTSVREWSWRNPNAKNYRKTLTEEIAGVVNGIRREPFKAVISRHHCSFCDANKVCPEWQRYSSSSDELTKVIATLGEGKVEF